MQIMRGPDRCAKTRLRGPDSPGAGTAMARMRPVHSLNRPHRLQAWFAIAILLLGMLAPSISAAVSHLKSDYRWQEICRSAASPQAAGDTQQQGPGEALDMLLSGHCAMCHLHHADLAPPPAPAPVLLIEGLDFVMPERFYSAPHTAHAWRAAPARAPPLKA